METEHIPCRQWIATIRRKDTLTEHRFSVDGESLVIASMIAEMQSKDRFSDLVKVEVLE